MSNNMPDSTVTDQGVLVSYRRLLGYVRPYWVRLAFGFLFGALYAGANYGFIWAIRTGLREAFGVDAEPSLAVVIGAVLFFPLVGLARGVADYLSRCYVRWVGVRIVRDLRDEMFSHLHDLSVSYFSERRTGELISRVSNDTVLVESAVSNVITDLAKQPVTLLAMVIWLFVLDVRLALISLLMFPLCVVPVLAFGARVRRHVRFAQERIADVVSILQETISGVRIVKAFGMESYESSRFEEQTRLYFDRIVRVIKAQNAIEPIVLFISMLSIAAVLVYVRLTSMPVEDFMAFLAALILMYEPVKRLARITVHLQQSSAAAQRVFSVLDTVAAVQDREGAVPLGESFDTITFDHVNFSYGDEPVLHDITFEVKAGERVAFVGSSGSGKTTLVNLVPRFYDVTNGALRIGETDVRDLTMQSLRGKIGLVTQETFLFNDTVANNISYGYKQASTEAIEDAARRAHAHEFILEMPNGYETIIGERGVRLSGGQRQRLAIARAILRNPPILILDEATSALDTESERMVQAALDELITGRTVLAIAHRLSTIANCNRIIVLDGGRIIERGSHDELMAMNGAYKRLYDLQLG